MDKHKFLIPTDFSAASENALEYAVDLAMQMNGEVVLFHSNVLPDSDPLSPAYTHHKIGNVEIEYQKIISDNMKELQKRVEERTKSQVYCEFVTEVGNPVGQMMEYTTMNAVDMIVIGISNNEMEEEYYVVRNIMSVIDKADLPVLVVPESYKYKPIKKIVYATDEGEENYNAINKLILFANEMNAEVNILHVSEDEEDADNFRQHFQSGIEQKMKKPLRFEAVRNEDVLDGIIAYNKINAVDVLSMRKHKRNFIERLFSESLTEKMATQTKIPLLIYHD